MAVTKTMTKATPYETSGKAQEWHLEMKYENDSEGTILILLATDQ